MTIERTDGALDSSAAMESWLQTKRHRCARTSLRGAVASPGMVSTWGAATSFTTGQWSGTFAGARWKSYLLRTSLANAQSRFEPLAASLRRRRGDAWSELTLSVPQASVVRTYAHEPAGLTHDLSLGEVSIMNSQSFRVAAAVVVGMLTACAAGPHASADAKITGQVRNAIAEHPDLGPPNRIYVDARGHTVYLTGTVYSDLAVADANDVARAVRGVSEVVSNIGVTQGN